MIEYFKGDVSKCLPSMEIMTKGDQIWDLKRCDPHPFFDESLQKYTVLCKTAHLKKVCNSWHQHNPKCKCTFKVKRQMKQRACVYHSVLSDSCSWVTPLSLQFKECSPSRPTQTSGRPPVQLPHCLCGALVRGGGPLKWACDAPDIWPCVSEAGPETDGPHSCCVRQETVKKGVFSLVKHRDNPWHDLEQKQRVSFLFHNRLIYILYFCC